MKFFEEIESFVFTEVFLIVAYFLFFSGKLQKFQTVCSWVGSGGCIAQWLRQPGCHLGWLLHVPRGARVAEWRPRPGGQVGGDWSQLPSTPRAHRVPRSETHCPSLLFDITAFLLQINLNGFPWKLQFCLSPCFQISVCFLSFMFSSVSLVSTVGASSCLNKQTEELLEGCRDFSYLLGFNTLFILDQDNSVLF